MDWLHNFSDKFKDDENLRLLKSNRFHGKVILNFADGVPHSAKIEMNIKPNSTLKEGE